VVESQKNVQGVPSVLLLSTTLNVYIKMPEKYGRLREIEHNGKKSQYMEGWISHDTERERFFAHLQ